MRITMLNIYFGITYTLTNYYTSEPNLLESPLSAEHLEKLFHESHFQAAIVNMSPLGKAFLRLYLSVKTNIATIATFVERLVTATNNPKSTVGTATMAEIAHAARAITSIQSQAERSRKDLYLFTLHPAAGNALYNTYNKEESIAAIGLKFDDPLIDKAAKEVEASRKAAEASKKAANNNTRGRGRGRGRGNDTYSGRNGHNNYASGSSSGFQYNNAYRGSYHTFRGGRGGFHPGNFNGNFQSHSANDHQGNGHQNQGQQNGSHAFQPQMKLGWVQGP